jgi:XTP/dITP diphosphohydrolase
MSEKRILVFATHNKHKAAEIQQLVGDSFLIQTLDDIGCTEDIAETGNTLLENAGIKSRYVTNTYGFDCFADDTGLEVEALDGAPGVYSARFAGAQRSDTDNMNLLLAKLDGSVNRKACFHTVISLNWEGKEHIFDGYLKGEIVTEKRGANGFGYDPIFSPEGRSETLAELSMEAKNAISHRARAMQQLLKFLLEQQ